MHRKLIACILIIAITCSPGGSGQLDVRYEPTSYEIVNLMLELAEVTGDDFVFDLGCGDGRIVIAAAAKRRARGVGIDIDPVRIKESRENALKAGVTDRVEFVEQDLFEADISEASVVMLYLLPLANLKLRPKLFSDLMPGTRIVSHEHDMDEWSPDRQMEVESGGRMHDVYFWVLPANVSGSWAWTMSMGEETVGCELSLDQRFQKLTGDITLRGETIRVEDITLKGDRIRFAFEDTAGNQTVLYAFDGAVSGDTIEGIVHVTTGAETPVLRWSASRDPSTMYPWPGAPGR